MNPHRATTALKSVIAAESGAYRSAPEKSGMKRTFEPFVASIADCYHCQSLVGPPLFVLWRAITRRSPVPIASSKQLK